MSIANYIYLPEFIKVESLAAILNTNIGKYAGTGDTITMWQLFHVEKGEVEIFIDNKAFLIKEGEAVFHPPGTEKRLDKKYDAQVNIVSFTSSSEAMDTLKNKKILLSVKQAQLISVIVEMGEKYIKRVMTGEGVKILVPREKTELYELQKLRNQLELLLIDIYTSFTHNSESYVAANTDNQDLIRFNKLTDYLENNIDKNLTLTDVSKNCVMSVSQLNRLCRKKCGMPIMSYFIQLKIEVAKNMINETKMNFTEISERLGFSSVHYFSKLFKNKVGLTPSEYAKKGM